MNTFIDFKKELSYMIKMIILKKIMILTQI
jgi:hypothetical protein